jgi:hypothetical protein
MPRYIRNAAIVGALVPLFWGIRSFIFFNAKESMWTNVYSAIVYITSPFWYLPGTAGMILMPILNAGVYALVAAGVVAVRRRFRSTRRSPL